jgi:hypothetical protein
MRRKRGGARGPGNPASRAAARGGLPGERHYQESQEQFEARLRRDRVLGLTAFAASLVVLLLNLVMEIDASLRLLPGGHSELYFLAGLLALGWSAWVAFDLGNSRRTRR